MGMNDTYWDWEEAYLQSQTLQNTYNYDVHFHLYTDEDHFATIEVFQDAVSAIEDQMISVALLEAQEDDYEDTDDE